MPNNQTPPTPNNEKKRKEVLIEKIRRACIKANPEIMELKLGCKVIIKDSCQQALYIRTWKELGLFAHQFMIIKEDQETCAIMEHASEHYTILGRNIQLADVLMVIRNTDAVKDMKSLRSSTWKLKNAKYRSNIHPLYWESSILKKWNLLKSLHEQKLLTLELISSLLPNDK